MNKDILKILVLSDFGYQTIEIVESQGVRVSPGLSCWEKKRAGSLGQPKGELISKSYRYESESGGHSLRFPDSRDPEQRIGPGTYEQ